MTTRAFFKVCLVLIFLNTIVEKHTLNAEVTLSYQFHVQNGLFKVPKIYNINFWSENDPPPLWNFSENSSDLVHPSLPKWHCCVLFSTDQSIEIVFLTKK